MEQDMEKGKRVKEDEAEMKSSVKLKELKDMIAAYKEIQAMLSEKEAEKKKDKKAVESEDDEEKESVKDVFGGHDVQDDVAAAQTAGHTITPNFAVPSRAGAGSSVGKSVSFEDSPLAKALETLKADLKKEMQESMSNFFADRKSVLKAAQEEAVSEEPILAKSSEDDIWTKARIRNE